MKFERAIGNPSTWLVGKDQCSIVRRYQTTRDGREGGREGVEFVGQS